MRRSLRALAAAALGLALLGFVIPPERVIGEMARLRSRQPPLRVRLELTGPGYGFSETIEAELHPLEGARVRDDRGGRWLIRGGRVLSRARTGVPEWLPRFEILVLREQEALALWLEANGVDARVNELARCGPDDCFVLGGRRGPSQLWIDKDGFEVRRTRASTGRGVDYQGYREWTGKARFPETILVSERGGDTWQLRTLSAAPAPELSAEDFSTAWLE